MQNARPARVAIVTNIPAPYRTPLFNQLSGNANLDIKVIFLGSTEGVRSWENTLQDATFSYKFAPGIHFYLRRIDLPVHLNPGVFSDLVRFSPDVVVTSGYDNIGYWLAALYVKVFRRKLVLWFGSTDRSMRIKRGIAWRLKKQFFRMTNSFLSYGTDSAETLERAGVERSLISVGLNTVDMETMKNRVAAIRHSAEFLKKRKQYQKFMFLYSGQLISRKRPDLLLDAYRELGIEDTGLMFIGVGPQMEELAATVEYQKIPNVYFEGFVPFEKLADYYALADAVVLPSDREVWGLVINEALAAGAYAIASDTSGCSADLLANPDYGGIFKSGDTNSLIQSMRTAYTMAEEIKKNRSSIAERSASEFGIHRHANAFENAVLKALT